MNRFEDTLFLLVLYRSLTIIIGLAIVYLGYRLFSTGVFEKAGDLKATWGNRGLLLKQASPGTFFAVFGAVIISTSLWKGITFDHSIEQGGNAPKVLIEQKHATEAIKPETVLRGTKAFAPLADSNYRQITAEIQTILEKVVSGNPVPEAERKRLGEWFKTERVHLRVYQDPEQLKWMYREFGLPSPIPEPGEKG